MWPFIHALFLSTSSNLVIPGGLFVTFTYFRACGNLLVFEGSSSVNNSGWPLFPHGPPSSAALAHAHGISRLRGPSSEGLPSHCLWSLGLGRGLPSTHLHRASHTQLPEYRSGPGAVHKLGQPLEMAAEWAGKNGPARMLQAHLCLFIWCTAHAASLEGLVVQPVQHGGMRLPCVTQMGTPPQEVGVRAQTFRSVQRATAPVYMLPKSSQPPR